MKRCVLALLACCYVTGHSQVYINEILVANASVNYDREYFNFSPWVEIHNGGSDTIHMVNFYLSDNPAMPGRWRFPDVAMLPGSYCVVWADKMNSGLHANFSLDAEGEFIGIYDSALKAVDTFSFGLQKTNISYGRLLADTSVWRYFGTPTPGKANSTPDALVQASKPAFALKGGYYPSAQSLLLGVLSPTAKIYYTTDGSEPGEQSLLYAGPIPIPSTSVIRARVFDAGFLPSDMATRTFFINDKSTLPVASIVVPSTYLWDDSIGIYTVGKNGLATKWGKTPANYNREWERAAHIEFYETPDSLAFQSYCGVEIFGSASRAFPQKSLDIKFKDKYGDGKKNYPLFKNRNYTEIHSLVLRNSGNDWQDISGYGYGLMFRDGMIQSLVAGQMDVDYMSYRPCLVYINGQFWGISDLREKLDQYYCNNLFPIDKDSLDMIKQNFNDKFDVQEGSAIPLQSFLEGVYASDLSVDSNYVRVKDSADIREFINYLIAETYSNNFDWPSNNLKIWQQKGVSKWRWMLFDMDFGFGGFGDIFSNMLDKAYNMSYFPTSAIIFPHLMESSRFRAEFVQTYAAHLNITFQYKRVKYIIDSIARLVQPEVERHSARWKAEGSIQSLNTWSLHLNGARNFASVRPNVQWNHLKGFMGLYDMSNLCIRRTDPEKGRVYVQGATLCDSFNIGSYFNHLPIELQAIPEKGYYFIWWEITKKGKVYHDKRLFLVDTINTSGMYDTVFYTAVFRKSPADTYPVPPLVIPAVIPDPPPVQALSADPDNVYSLYPNPANDILFIRSIDEMPADAGIYNAMGVLVCEKRLLSGVNAIDITGLQPGLYLVQINSGTKNSTKRFVKL